MAEDSQAAEHASVDRGVAFTLKEDVFGLVERVECRRPDGGAVTFVRRVARGRGVPGAGLVARRLLLRERRALQRLGGLPGVPELAERSPFPAPARPASVLHREWIEGVPLFAARLLPQDYFERLEDLVRSLHAAGVCHNDLHKEGNVLVATDGSPRLIDFQLASVHPRGGKTLAVRAAEDLRHVAKHRRRYLAAGDAAVLRSTTIPPRRSRLAAAWMRFGKPVYNLVTRRLLRRTDGERKRRPSDPWPRWGPPLGPAGVAPEPDPERRSPG